MPYQPAPDERGLVGPVVIHDQVDVQAVRHIGVDMAEERAELHGAVSPLTLAQHFARFDLQRSEQGRGAVAHVVVRPPFDLPRPHRQQRLRAVQRLDLAFLIHAQDQGLLRRAQIQPDNVAHFFDEQGIVGEFEGFTPGGSDGIIAAGGA